MIPASDSFLIGFGIVIDVVVTTAEVFDFELVDDAEAVISRLLPDWDIVGDG